MPTRTLEPTDAVQPGEQGAGQQQGSKDPARVTKAKTNFDDAPPAANGSWTRLCQGFLRCHRQPLNVALHLVTTPACLLGLYAILGWYSPVAMGVFAALHVIVVCFMTPPGVAAVHGLAVAAITTLAWWLAPGPIVAAVLFAAGYGLQEFSHWLTDEPTYQSTYRESRRWWHEFVEHTVLLLPVLLVIASRWRQSPFRVLVARKAIHTTKLTSPGHRRDFESILKWVRDEHPVITQSNHWWQSDMSDEPSRAFSRLAQDPQLKRMIRAFHGTGFSVDAVNEMNEIYVTGPSKKATSDTVFYMGHVDGPWAVYPGARLYRCMLSLNQNLEVTTHFPMARTSYRVPESHRLEHGDAVAFDFNRELHYITRQPDANQTEPRINLKLHFVAYPTSLTRYGKLLQWLTTSYDIRARNLFLQTIQPKGVWPWIKTRWVLGWTKLFELIVRHVGWTNLAYVIVAAAAAMISRTGLVFVAMTSFVHYAIYIGTFQERTPVSFGTFRRDAMFFKSLSLTQLFALYASCFGDQYLSAALVVGGFTLAGYASRVIGMDRTLFSAELGFDEPKRISKFPFGVIPHPMILGAMIGIGSMALVPEFAASYGWLIAGHVLCYVAVMGHEIAISRGRTAENRTR